MMNDDDMVSMVSRKKEEGKKRPRRFSSTFRILLEDGLPDLGQNRPLASRFRG